MSCLTHCTPSHALLALLVVIPTARAQGTAGTALLELTSLSPLLTYTPDPTPGNTDPSTGWVTDAYGTWTNTTNNASVSVSWWGGETVLYGNLSRVVTRVDADYIQADNADSWEPHDWFLTWPQVQYRPSQDGPRPSSNAEEGQQQTQWGGVAFRTFPPVHDFDGSEDRDLVPWQTWDVTWSLDQTSTYGRVINISRVHLGVGLPYGSDLRSDGVREYPFKGATLVAAVNESSSSLPQGWTDPNNAWSASPPPINGTRFEDTRQEDTSIFYLPTLPAIQNTSSVILYTSTPNAPLVLSAPNESSLFILYGAVGPDQGEFDIRLSILDGEDQRDFQPHPLNRSFDANRQVAAMNEVLAAMWLDPRLRYDVQVVSTEPGRNMTIQAVAWIRSLVGNYQGDWWSSWNDYALGKGDAGDGGLSEGQLAGIVVGSVVGVLLIVGLIVFFLCRRKIRQRDFAKGQTSGDGKTSPSQMLVDDKSTASKRSNT